MDITVADPLYRLKEITSLLRGENGCPWDREQDSMSLRKYLIEEAYEVIDAIESDMPDKIVEELGDLLYQIYAHAQIAGEKKQFTIEDVANGISDKLIRRHPHVFGDETIETGDAVADRWEKIKKSEKKGNESILDGVPRHLPALLRAYRAQEKTSRIGFDWNDINDVEKKLDEEIDEFKKAVELHNGEMLFDEFGDILFTMVNIARFLKIDAEDALRQSTDKFMRRFRFVESHARENSRELSDMSLDELDALWNEAKRTPDSRK